MLFECLLRDPHTQVNGRAGQIQFGVDIVGQRNGSDGWVGVQCKRREFEYSTSISETELRAEVSKAKSFRPSLSEYFLVTSAPHDAKIQEVARLISEEERANGRALKVSVWGWEALEIEIRQHARAIQAFHPDATPNTIEILTLSREHSVKLDILLKHLALISSRTSLGEATHRASSQPEPPAEHIHSDAGDQFLHDVAKYLAMGNLAEVLYYLTRGIDRLPRFVGTVYQGRTVKQPLISFLKKFEPGNAIMTSRYWHTSQEMTDAFAGNVLFVISSLTGRLVPAETGADIVFLPGTKFIAMACELADDLAVVELVESAAELGRVEIEI